MQLRLTPPPPYDFAHSTAAARFLYTAAQRMSDGSLRRVVRVGERLALLECRDNGQVECPVITTRVLAADGEIDPALLEAKVLALINAGVDLHAFYHANDDPPLRQTVVRLRGLRALGADTLFEALALTMIEQQITLKMAQVAERWLMSWAGGWLDYEGERYYTFPTPERLANATVDELAPMKITRVRMGRLITLARQITASDGSFEALRQVDAETLYPRLRAISGVGHWTAAWAMIRGIGHYAYLGNADVALRAAVNHYYFGLPGRIDRDAMDAIFARYGEHGGLAAFYVLMRWAFERYSTSL
ncbi:MAG: DNA-3-methyladenine glycosylase 2 family protein [Anaerolineae bacterium]|nr:DNA-3-methyladenine glycosylase 2 family protein [Anaerolineae bacterium]